MTNKDRVLKLLDDIRVADKNTSLGLILAYAIEIRRETDARSDITYCDEMLRSTEYVIGEWQRRREQAHHRLALARGEENE